jgi:acyl-ACP thioesterase
MLEAIWTEKYKIASYLVNLRGRAGLFAILNLIQDVGWLHGFHLGVRLPKNRGWVFTRQKLTMSEWPPWNEEVTLRTWIRPPSPDGFLYRDYEIYLKDRKIGDCTSTFTVMDQTTRKIAMQDWSEYSTIWRQDGHLSHKPEKILAPEPVEEVARFQVRNSDIDLNQHMNNTKYAQWILDAIPIDLLRAGIDLHAYEVNFLAECRVGDLVSLQKSKEEQKKESSSLITFQGVRAADQKTVFTAQLTVTP